MIPNILVKRNRNGRFHLNSDRNYRNLWHNGKHPICTICIHVYPSVWQNALNYSPMLEMSLSCSLSESMFEHRESTIVSTWCSLTLLTRGPRLEESKTLGNEYTHCNFKNCIVHLQHAKRMREGGRDGRLA